MDQKMVEAIIESLLFTMGKAVSIHDLAQVMDISETYARNAARDLASRYAERESGIRIIELEDSFQMCSSPEMYDYINALTHQPKKYTMTNVMLETLAIIAYRQPITRGEIERIRGVNCSHPINKLLDYDLIMEAGRLNAPGRPILFATTEEFLRAFGVSSPSALPPIPEDKLNLFREEARAEADSTISV